MSHFAQIDENNIVVQVIVAEQDFIDSGAVGDPRRWIQTSYNTLEGKHLAGGTPLRKNYAGIGYKYDAERDAFIPPHPRPEYESWKIDEERCVWVPPVPYPTDGEFYIWEEALQEWKKQL